MEMEKISLDFSGDAMQTSICKLGEILGSGHWSDKELNFQDAWAPFLCRMLEIGGITLYQRRYEQRDDTPELRQRANLLNSYVNKRSVDQTLLDITGMFSDYEFDIAKSMHNSLFFPKLNSYVRYGGLSPERLLELLEKDGCDGVLLFHETYANSDTVFHAFLRAMPKELFLEAMADVRAKRMEAMFKAVRAATDESVFPTVPTIDD